MLSGSISATESPSFVDDEDTKRGGDVEETVRGADDDEDPKAS